MSVQLRQHDMVVFAHSWQEFTSPGCLKCIRAELQYVIVHEALQDMKVILSLCLPRSLASILHAALCLGSCPFRVYVALIFSADVFLCTHSVPVVVSIYPLCADPLCSGQC